MSSALADGAPGTTGGLLATLYFHVAAVGDGSGTIDFGFSSLDGNILQYGDSSTDTPIFTGGRIVVGVIPEPATLLLVGIGLVGLAYARGRR